MPNRAKWGRVDRWGSGCYGWVFCDGGGLGCCCAGFCLCLWRFSGGLEFGRAGGCEGDLGGGQEGGTFDEAAELFFGDADHCALAADEIGEGFVIDGLAGPFDDPEIGFALLPDLPLFEF